jgi:hypothetical protein
VPPARVHERDVPIHFGGYPFLDIDSIAYELPDGYDVEAVPKPVVIETPFAHYEAGVERQDDGTLVYRRRMELRDVTWPPEPIGSTSYSWSVKADTGRPRYPIVGMTESTATSLSG